MASDSNRVTAADVIDGWKVLRPDIDPTSFSTIAHISRLAAIVRRIAGEVSGRYGITESDSRILLAIRGNFGGMRPSALGTWLDITRATMTYRTDRLLGMGLVERSSDEKDGRVLNVHLTPKGLDLIDVIMTEVNTLFHARLAPLDSVPGGRRTLLDYLEILLVEWEREDASATDGRPTADADGSLERKRGSS